MRGRVLIVDQIAIDHSSASARPLRRARDPSHTRLLPDTDIRSCSTRTGSCCARWSAQEARDVDGYLDLAGCAGDDRHALSVAPENYSDDRLVPRHAASV